MTRTLILMRHGKSGYPDGVADHERPLADRGIREATLAGEWLRRDGLDIDVALCSSARRTRETLQRTGYDPNTVIVEELYDADVDDVTGAIRTYVPADATTVLVIGHEPGMPATARALDPTADIDHFPTSAYAVLEIAAPWDQVGHGEPATLRALVIPR